MLLRRSIVILRKSPEAGDCLHHPLPNPSCEPAAGLHLSLHRDYRQP
jgi:hypothetical protein